MISGFVKVEKGLVRLTVAGRQDLFKAPATLRVSLGTLIEPEAPFNGSFYLFDGSVYPLKAGQSIYVSPDGLLLRKKNGWPMIHGYRVRLNRTNLNGEFGPDYGMKMSWYAAGNVVAVTSSGPQPVTSSGELKANEIIRTGARAVAKCDFSENGIALLRGNTTLRYLPGGIGLEEGGLLVHLGRKQESAIWTSRVCAKAVRAFLEVSVVGNRDVFRILRGRVVFTPVFGSEPPRAAGPGMMVTISVDGKINVKRFKKKSDAHKVARDLIARLEKPRLEGFPRFVKRATGGTVAPYGPVPKAPAGAPVARRPSKLPPGRPAGAPVARTGGSFTAPAASFQPSGRRAEIVAWSQGSPSKTPAGTIRQSPGALVQARSASRQAGARPGPPPGSDREGTEFLNPLRKALPGAQPSDWK